MPETSDGKKFDYTTLGMMKAKMHQQRLDKNKKGMGKYSKSAIVAGASIPAFLAGIELTNKIDKANKNFTQGVQNKWDSRVQRMDMSRIHEAARRWDVKNNKAMKGGGGGIGGFGKFSTINRASRSGSKLKLPPKDFLY